MHESIPKFREYTIDNYELLLVKLKANNDRIRIINIDPGIINLITCVDKIDITEKLYTRSKYNNYVYSKKS